MLRDYSKRCISYQKPKYSMCSSPGCIVQPVYSAPSSLLDGKRYCGPHYFDLVQVTCMCEVCEVIRKTPVPPAQKPTAPPTQQLPGLPSPQTWVQGQVSDLRGLCPSHAEHRSSQEAPPAGFGLAVPELSLVPSFPSNAEAKEFSPAEDMKTVGLKYVSQLEAIQELHRHVFHHEVLPVLQNMIDEAMRFMGTKWNSLQHAAPVGKELEHAVFGSRMVGVTHAMSDIDVVFCVPKKRGELWRQIILQNLLESAKHPLKVDVDSIDYKYTLRLSYLMLRIDFSVHIGELASHRPHASSEELRRALDEMKDPSQARALCKLILAWAQSQLLCRGGPQLPTKSVWLLKPCHMVRLVASWLKWYCPEKHASLSHGLACFFRWAATFDWSRNEIGLDCIGPRSSKDASAMLLNICGTNVTARFAESTMETFLSRLQELVDRGSFQEMKLIQSLNLMMNSNEWNLPIEV